MGCVPEEKQEQYVIGVSQCQMNNAWRQSMVRDMRLETLNHPELKLRVADAERNTQRQIEQIEQFIQDRVDLLIISANESAPITPWPLRLTKPAFLPLSWIEPSIAMFIRLLLGRIILELGGKPVLLFVLW